MTDAAALRTFAKTLTVGTPADDVRLQVITAGLSLHKGIPLGRDRQGQIVAWKWGGLSLIMRRWAVGGIRCYRLSQIIMQDDDATSETQEDAMPK